MDRAPVTGQKPARLLRLLLAVAAVFFCLFPFLSAHAQSRSAPPPDLHQLQQQVTNLTAGLDSTGFLVTAVLLFFMAAACLGFWWSARTFRAFRSVGLYLLMVSAIFFADYLWSRRWDSFFTCLASLFFVDIAADALRLSKRQWIIPVRIICITGVVFTWLPGLGWYYLVPVDLSDAVVFIILLVRLRRPIPQVRLIFPAIALVWLFRLPLDPTIRSESAIHLAPNDRLTFLSDGVIEAQSAAGELFGFDRTRAISTQSAEAIAAAAQAHGQEDDITVLTLTFAPAEVLHA